MENETIFPKPNEVLQMQTPLHLAVLDVKERLTKHNFKFKPEYQTQRFFNEIQALLRDADWKLTKDADNTWNIEPWRG